ncbi:hypothetical protein ACFXPV_36635 [Streptomyces sp. NPDC059118]|uniref:hypothetical protein n=1 Tax=unclassified Streptomyces TaxID=2593676 RepID=UPI0036AA4545
MTESRIAMLLYPTNRPVAADHHLGADRRPRLKGNPRTYLEVCDAARAALLALEVPGCVAHSVYLCAPEIIVPYPTEELLRRYHPGTVLRCPLPGRMAPVDTSAARGLLGFTARNLLGTRCASG